MPSTLNNQTRLTFAGFAWHYWALAASLLLSLYFIYDFTQARQLYAVAAGIHAWLEWPLIALLLVLHTQRLALNTAQ